MLYPRHRSAAETLGSSTRTEASPHGGASSLRWMRKCQAHRSLPRDLLSSAPNTSLRKARPVVAQGGLSAFHSLFVIIRARRRTNHQILHSLSRPDPIITSPLTGCPSLRHTVVPGNAKLTKQKHPDRISPANHYRFPLSLSRDSPNTRNHYQNLPVTRAGFGSDFYGVLLPE